MRTRGTIRIGLISLSIIAGFWGISKLCHCVLHASQFSFTFDPALSKTQQEKIVYTISQTSLAHPVLIAECIKTKCPAVDQVAIIRQPNHSWHVTVSAAKPLLIINDTWILNNQGTVLSCSHYAADHLENIHHITMHNPTGVIPYVSPLFKQWLCAHDQHFFNRYGITWHNDYEIVLTQKDNPAFTMISTCLQTITDHTLAVCGALQKELSQRSLSGHKAHTWKADIRFEKQIVISGIRQGNNHG